MKNHEDLIGRIIIAAAIIIAALIIAVAIDNGSLYIGKLIWTTH